MSEARVYTYSLCRDESTLNAVVALRQLANVQSGRAHADAPTSAWRDSWDERSEILVAQTLAGEVVATVRVSAPAEGDVWPTGPLAETPSVEERAASADVTRMAVHPDHRGGALAVMMAAFMCVLTWRRGRTRLLGSCGEDVMDFWTRLGITITPHQWPVEWPYVPYTLHGSTLVLGDAPPLVMDASPALQRAVEVAWSYDLGPLAAHLSSSSTEECHG